MLDAAETLADLLVPPCNRLEKLTGDGAGQYSVRVNQQWRICFTWSDAGPARRINEIRRRTLRT
jgi:proteic killer suppression protein